LAGSQIDAKLVVNSLRRRGAADVTSRPNAPLRVLIVEDSEFDAVLIANALRSKGLDPGYVRVHTVEGLAGALARQTWDVVLCDFNLPKLSGHQALAQVRAHDADLPFILVSGTVFQHVVVEMLKAGANDCVMKSDLPRLAAAVTRALGDAESQRRRRQLEQALRRSEANFRSLVMQSADGFFLGNAAGDLLLVNARLADITGYTETELLGMRAAALLPMENPRVSAFFQSGPGPGRLGIEHELRRRDGSVAPVEISLQFGEEGDVLALVRDLSPRISKP